MPRRPLPALALLALLLVVCERSDDPAFPGAAVASAQAPAPSFAVDPYWPRPLPDDWLLGNVVGVATDSRDNVWIIHRPNSQRGAETTPPVIAFDPDGRVVHGWGGTRRRLRVGHAGPTASTSTTGTTSGWASAAGSPTT